MSYYICGIGFVTPENIGCGRDLNNINLNNGKLLPITRKDVLDQPYKPFGRMDFFSKLGFSGIYFAYKDAGLIDDQKKSNTSIIASTLFGCLDTDMNFFNTIKSDNGKNASPALFAYTLPNTFLGEASIYLKLCGESFVINKDTTDGITALKMTFDLLDSGESDFVLCGICDTNVPKFIKNHDNYFSGSLFFTISKKKQSLCYGEIEENSEGNIVFNKKEIRNLLMLAKACIEIKTN
jgi:3-oxoacyl-[acyl-carrier-protein] synthase II